MHNILLVDKTRTKPRIFNFSFPVYEHHIDIEDAIKDHLNFHGNIKVSYTWFYLSPRLYTIRNPSHESIRLKEKYGEGEFIVNARSYETRGNPKPVIGKVVRVRR